MSAKLGMTVSGRITHYNDSLTSDGKESHYILTLINYRRLNSMVHFKMPKKTFYLLLPSSDAMT